MPLSLPGGIIVIHYLQASMLQCFLQGFVIFAEPWLQNAHPSQDSLLTLQGKLHGFPLQHRTDLKDFLLICRTKWGLTPLYLRCKNILGANSKGLHKLLSFYRAFEGLLPINMH